MIDFCVALFILTFVEFFLALIAYGLELDTMPYESCYLPLNDWSLVQV
jgi:hypothetical protein